MELCTSTLDIFIRNKLKGPVLGMVNDITRQIVAGLQHLHRFGIVHGDLKPSNILISGQKGDMISQVKLSDIGVRHLITDKGLSLFSNEKGRFRAARTKGWMPMDHKMDFPFDIFSAGLVIGYTICRGNYCCLTFLTNYEVTNSNCKRSSSIW